MRKGAKLTDDKKEEQFKNWKESAEHNSILKFIHARSLIPVLTIDMSDISFPIQDFLDELNLLSIDLKVPGRKAKRKQRIEFIEKLTYIFYQTWNMKLLEPCFS